MSDLAAISYSISIPVIEIVTLSQFQPFNNLYNISPCFNFQVL